MVNKEIPQFVLVSPETGCYVVLSFVMYMSLRVALCLRPILPPVSVDLVSTHSLLPYPLMILWSNL